VSRDEDYTSFVAARYQALVRTAYLLVGDRGHAEDLVQSALVKTYTAWPRLRQPEYAEAYARKTLVRVAVRWRARRWHGEVPTAHILAASPAPEHNDLTDVRRALSALPVGQRAVLVLRFLDDLSEARTAQLLGISPGTVKSRTARALAALRTSEVLRG
jgi:RNA polymerase sigma-70 factor (sigma-E family)